jgi:diguanylate cyclase (GGDEF)-like protein
MAARDIANIDPLTGLKNKHAYVDLETHLDKMIDEKSVPDFAIIVFDINDLKEINDTRGHQAGDQYIKDGCRRICNAFKHSPVFRIGGDEFVAIAQGDDYKNVDELFKKFRETNEKNVGTGAVVIASGMKKRRDEKSVAAVFEKADKQMYLNKRHLKELHTR